MYKGHEGIFVLEGNISSLHSRHYGYPISTKILYCITLQTRFSR